MYQLGTTQAGTVLATTGAIAGFSVVGAWTLVVAGLALVMTARVLRKRLAERR